MAFYARRKLLLQSTSSNEELIVDAGLFSSETRDQRVDDSCRNDFELEGRRVAAKKRTANTSKALRRKSSRFASISADALDRPAEHRNQAPAMTDTRGSNARMAAYSGASGGSSTPAGLDGVPAWRIAFGNIAAGAVAGATVEAVLYPIDTIKTRLQAMRSGGGLSALLKGGGGKALYSGIFGNLAGVVPSSAIFMGVYEPIKKAVQEAVPEEKSFLAPIAGGAGAGVAASFVRVPTEVIKQRMQTGEFSRAVVAIRSIVAAEGIGGLYAGYKSFLLRDLPFDAIEFLVYEQMKVMVKRIRARELNPAETSAIGAVAGATTGLVTTPLDVIKTRLMIQGTQRTYSGVVDCAVKIAQQEGVATLFRGWEPRVLWIGIGGCVFFTALEEAKKLFAPQPPKPSCCSGKKSS